MENAFWKGHSFFLFIDGWTILGPSTSLPLTPSSPFFCRCSPHKQNVAWMAALWVRIPTGWTKPIWLKLLIYGFNKKSKPSFSYFLGGVMLRRGSWLISGKTHGKGFKSKKFQMVKCSCFKSGSVCGSWTIFEKIPMELPLPLPFRSSFRSLILALDP